MVDNPEMAYFFGFFLIFSAIAAILAPFLFVPSADLSWTAWMIFCGIGCMTLGLFLIIYTYRDTH